MAPESVRIGFDPEGDFLEVLFETEKPGYFRETDDDRVMEKVDEEGHTLGFSILSVSTLKSQTPLEVALKQQRCCDRG